MTESTSAIQRCCIMMGFWKLKSNPRLKQVYQRPTRDGRWWWKETHSTSQTFVSVFSKCMLKCHLFLCANFHRISCTACNTEVLKLSERQHSMKSSWADSRVKVWKFSDVSGTDYVSIFRGATDGLVKPKLSRQHGQIPMIPSGIESATFPLLAQCLNLLYHSVRPYVALRSKHIH